MKLSVRQRALSVALAEAACLQAHVARVDAVNAARGELRRVATPLRIVGAGLVAGIAAGLMPVRTKTESTGPLGHLLGMAMDSLLPSLMAGFAAAQAAGEEVATAGEEIAESVADEVADDVADDVAARVGGGAP